MGIKIKIATKYPDVNILLIFLKKRIRIGQMLITGAVNDILNFLRRKNIAKEENQKH